MTIRTPRLTLVTVLGLALLVAACGSDNSSSPSATSATSSSSAVSTTSAGASAALCAARDSLKSSVQDLTSVDVIKNGTSALQAALTTVKTDLQAVKSAASADLQPQVKAMEDAMSQLATAVTNVSSAGVAGVATAVQQVGRTASTLLTTLQNLKCS